MLTLVTFAPGSTIATSSLSRTGRTGVLVCLLAIVVIVVDLRRPRNHDIHGPALISNRNRVLLIGGWPTVATLWRAKTRHRCDLRFGGPT